MALFSKKPQICPICSAELDGRASALRLESHWETHVVVIQPGQGDASGQYTWYCSCGPAGMKWEKHFAAATALAVHMSERHGFTLT
jgi:hypothetical protein